MYNLKGAAYFYIHPRNFKRLQKNLSEIEKIEKDIFLWKIICHELLSSRIWQIEIIWSIKMSSITTL